MGKKNVKKFIIIGFCLFIISGCSLQPTVTRIEPAPLPDFSSNDFEEELKLNSYTLELGRSDADIQSQKTYTFYLPLEIEFEVMGIDAPSTLIEFKKDGKTIFSWQNRDYVVESANFDVIYPERYNYSFIGGHTNILFFSEVDNSVYIDDLSIFENSLKIDGQKVF